MFSLFRKDQNKIKITDRVFISSKAKQIALAELVRNKEDVILIAWFDESYDQVKELLTSNNFSTEIYLAKEISAHNSQNKKPVFVEHHPLLKKETELLEKLQLKEALFYSSLDESLFQHFGGEKLISLMKNLGLSENEAIEHPMITSSIKNAQEKISEKVFMEHSATSQTEWFSKNLPK